MGALVKKLMHVCITVTDLDEALKFYRDVLGFESVFETDNDRADGRLLGFDAEDIGVKAHHVLAVGVDHEQATEINLIEYTRPRTISDEGPYRQMNHPGITRLALLVDSADEAFREIQPFEGVDIVCEPKDIVIREPGLTFTSRWFSFTDPFGVFITITEPPRP